MQIRELMTSSTQPNFLSSTKIKESDPPTLHCAPVVVYERRGPQKLSFHDNASKITN